MKKSLARLDLNLLFTLQLLLQERSVSKTAKKLNLTPSTVSKSLNKLRDWFDDPLFVKTPKGLAPTPLAQSMEQELADWLQIGSQIAEKRSDVAAKGMRFDLCIESPLVLTILSKLLTKIRQRYPDAKVKTSNWDYDSLDAIILGEADIGFTGRESHPMSKESLDLLPYFLDFEVLSADIPVVYLRKDHPALSHPWNLDAFLRYPHINILWERNEKWALDDVLTELGLQRNIALTMSSFEQSLFMAAQPNHQMLTTAPRYALSYVQSLHPDLVCLPIPIDQPLRDKLSTPFTLIWHKRNAYNPKLIWLRETIKSLYEQSLETKELDNTSH
ncbi:HTH-type transcriptional regulator YidZ [Vibrio panuliri]|uniref:DNA-binding transcriptional regulator n=1 Tax=Vibrio panuliri TaxID=1381081 RepID=A0ABX3FKT5_9VIBR|nr:HTH-type transcriptional regulator YidZ [Vibrio panuliri]KAB1457863.1 HTH-type transcriptional regulator YidZ [Vibrio panuliri]OLQ94510.1 DNA-binding transcriptional regulator [Vibrio panuliri]